ncbi:hypothetical protein WS73_01140 [Burkholderia savannae]|nr:hypothetical protein WS73_01140 [Burkholderia savannae]
MHESRARGHAIRHDVRDAAGGWPSAGHPREPSSQLSCVDGSSCAHRDSKGARDFVRSVVRERSDPMHPMTTHGRRYSTGAGDERSRVTRYRHRSAAW